MGLKARGGPPKSTKIDKNRYKIRFSKQETDFLHKRRSWDVESVEKIFGPKKSIFRPKIEKFDKNFGHFQ